MSTKGFADIRLQLNPKIVTGKLVIKGARLAVAKPILGTTPTYCHEVALP
jgi:uncharacterized protein (DUF433 family)